jgi:hypothetical protein
MSDIQTATPVKTKTAFFNEKGYPRTWTLTYRYGNQISVKNFVFDGTLPEAMHRGRSHCEIMNLRFIIVRPLFVDLDYQEKAYLDGKYKEAGVPDEVIA